MANFWH